MTDRVPGAPGQYKATITQEELLKLQNGEDFTITLVRNDQPLVEGTPYNKASVLPEELAEKICPTVTDPTPADAFRGLHGNTVAVMLSVSGWADGKQTVSVAGVTADNRVFVSPEPSAENYEEYTGCGVRCIAQSVGTLTFICDSEPAIAVVANVSVQA